MNSVMQMSKRGVLHARRVMTQSTTEVAATETRGTSRSAVIPPLRRQNHKGQQGFTLIELLVVIAVLAILAAIVIFNVTGVTNRGTSSACVTDLNTIQTASDEFYSDHKAYPADMTDLVPTYLHTTPTDVGTVTFDADGKGTVTSNAC